MAISTKTSIEVPPLRKGRLNIYSPEQIMSFGSMEKFLDHIAQKEPITFPSFGFTEDEQKQMDYLLKHDS